MKNKKKLTVIFVQLLFVFSILIVLFLSMNMNRKNRYKKNNSKKEIVYKKPEILKSDNIVFLGDSIVEYYPIDSIYYDLPIVKSGVAGYKTTDILSRMDSMVYAYNPTKVILLIGTNDIMIDKDGQVDEVYTNIKKIVSNIRKNRSHAKIYIQSIYPVNKKVDSKQVADRNNNKIKKINKKILEYCKEQDLQYINMYDKLTDSEGNLSSEYTSDGLHPNDLGYARISQVLIKYIYDM